MTLTIAAGCEPIQGYKLIKQLGQGGFGEVWQAEAPGGVPVALKFVRIDSAAAGAEIRAMEVIRSIRHPHLLDIQFAVTIENRMVVAMPLCDKNLWDRFQECQSEGLPGIPRAELMQYMDESARAIDFLNEPRHAGPDGRLIGVQHRDIKPHNLFLVGESVRVADFGMAKILEDHSTANTGSMTPYYVSPEMLRGTVSQYSDQYSLAVSYCHLRTGQLPFPGNVHAVMYGHVNNKPKLNYLPPNERAVIRRALAKNPEERFPNCKAFVEALRIAIGDKPDNLQTYLDRIQPDEESDTDTDSDPTAESARTLVISKLFRPKSERVNIHVDEEDEDEDWGTNRPRRGGVGLAAVALSVVLLALIGMGGFLFAQREFASSEVAEGEKVASAAALASVDTPAERFSTKAPTFRPLKSEQPEDAKQPSADSSPSEAVDHSTSSTNAEESANPSSSDADEPSSQVDPDPSARPTPDLHAEDSSNVPMDEVEGANGEAAGEVTADLTESRPTPTDQDTATGEGEMSLAEGAEGTAGQEDSQSPLRTAAIDVDEPTDGEDGKNPADEADPDKEERLANLPPLSPGDWIEVVGDEVEVRDQNFKELTTVRKGERFQIKALFQNNYVLVWAKPNAGQMGYGWIARDEVRSAPAPVAAAPTPRRPPPPPPSSGGFGGVLPNIVSGPGVVARNIYRKGDRVAVTVGQANVGFSNRVIATVRQGQVFEVLESKGNYLKIRTYGGEGWINMRDVSPSGAVRMPE